MVVRRLKAPFLTAEFADFQIDNKVIIILHMNSTTTPLETHFNRINDRDSTWIGFRRLKPVLTERMSVRTVLVLSLFYAPVIALIVTATFYLLGFHGAALWLGSVVGALGFVFLQSLSAWFWNRRASRLQLDQGKLQKDA